MRCNYLYIALLVISFLSGSCNLFETRDPEDPENPNQSLPQATDEFILLQNFHDAFFQKNLYDYEGLFADTISHTKQFVFLPSVSAETRYSTVFLDWGKIQESSYFQKVVVASGTLPFNDENFITTRISPYRPDSAVYRVEYALLIPHKRINIPALFVGFSEIFMSPDKNNIWRIYRWVDYETKKDSSWSELKGYFAK